jgi:carbonic anhydrase
MKSLCVKLSVLILFVAACMAHSLAWAAEKPASKAQAASKSQAASKKQTASKAQTPAQAKELLVQGNKRFLAQDQNIYSIHKLNEHRRVELAKRGQHPFATILSCSDSRVPPELLFNTGLGDIFVIRVAGNVLDPVATGSIEYANLLGVPLIVVMGHDHCGAVHATIEGGHVSQSIKSIIKEIKPSLDAVKANSKPRDKEALQAAVESRNISVMVSKLKKNPALKARLDAGKLAVVGAKYSLETGKVEFF